MGKPEDRAASPDEMIHRALRAIDHGVVVADSGGVVRFVTDAFLRLCGKPGADLAGPPVSALFPPGEFERVRSGLRKSSPDDTWRFEISPGGQGGPSAPFELTVRKVRDSAAGALSYARSSRHCY